MKRMLYGCGNNNPFLVDFLSASPYTTFILDDPTPTRSSPDPTISEMTSTPTTPSSPDNTTITAPTSIASPITTPQSGKVNSTSSAPTTPAPIGLCGRANGEGADPSNPDIQSMVANEFPWLAFLYFDNLQDKMWCTGALISPKWIMTAASCLHNDRYYIHFF